MRNELTIVGQDRWFIQELGRVATETWHKDFGQDIPATRALRDIEKLDSWKAAAEALVYINRYLCANQMWAAAEYCMALRRYCLERL